MRLTLEASSLCDFMHKHKRCIHSRESLGIYVSPNRFICWAMKKASSHIGESQHHLQALVYVLEDPLIIIRIIRAFTSFLVFGVVATPTSHSVKGKGEKTNDPPEM